MVCGGRGQTSNHIGGIAPLGIRRKHQHGPHAKSGDKFVSTITCSALYVFECLSFIQLYTRRKKFLKGGEKVYWDQINPSYMSEESTHESDGEVVVHKHTPVFRLEGKGVIRLRFEASVIHVLLTLAGLNKLIKNWISDTLIEQGQERHHLFHHTPVSCVHTSKAKPSADAPSWDITRPHRRGSEASSVLFTEPLHSPTPAACSAGPSRDVADQTSSFLQSSSLGI